MTRSSVFFGYVDQLRNHPGHSSQKSHGRKGEGGETPDGEGKFAHTSDDDDDSDIDSDQDLPGGRAGKYGYGVDPDGVSYDELDVDPETGEPRFNEDYRSRYGSVTSESVHDTADGRPIAVVETRKGPFLHVADDSRGTKQREVVQEFTKRESGELGDAVWTVYRGMLNNVATKSGVSVTAASDNPRADGVRITFASGQVRTFAGTAGNDAAFALQESLSISADSAKNSVFFAHVAHNRVRTEG